MSFLSVVNHGQFPWLTTMTKILFFWSSYCCLDPHVTSIVLYYAVYIMYYFILHINQLDLNNMYKRYLHYYCILAVCLLHTSWAIGVRWTQWGVSCNGLLTVEAWAARDADLWAWVGLILSCGTWQGHRRAHGTVVTLKRWSLSVYLLSSDWCERGTRWKNTDITLGQRKAWGVVEEKSAGQ